MSDDDECTWFTHETNVETRPVCDENGAYSIIRLEKNNLEGTLPLELALLSDSLCKFKALPVLYCSCDIAQT
jgi:hypothetical protein